MRNTYGSMCASSGRRSRSTRSARNSSSPRPASAIGSARPIEGTFPDGQDYFSATGRAMMARKYSKKASAKVERAMKKRNAGTLKSGRSGKKVTSRKQAIAIGLSEARAAGQKVPRKAAKRSAAEKSGRKSKK